MGVRIIGRWALMPFNLLNTFVPPFRTIRATPNSTLKMEATDSFLTLVFIWKTAGYYSPEKCNIETYNYLFAYFVYHSLRHYK